MAGKRVYVIGRKGQLHKRRIALITDTFGPKTRVSVEVKGIGAALELAGRNKNPRQVYIVFVSKAGMRKAKGIKKRQSEYNVVVFTDFAVPEQERKGVIVHKLDKTEDVKEVVRF